MIGLIEQDARLGSRVWPRQMSAGRQSAGLKPANPRVAQTPGSWETSAASGMDLRRGWSVGKRRSFSAKKPRSSRWHGSLRALAGWISNTIKDSLISTLRFQCAGFVYYKSGGSNNKGSQPFKDSDPIGSSSTGAPNYNIARAPDRTSSGRPTFSSFQSLSQTHSFPRTQRTCHGKVIIAPIPPIGNPSAPIHAQA